MTIALLGSGLAPAQRRALALPLADVERATLRLYVGARVPARPPRSPWLWLAPRGYDPTAAAAAVLAGAYDVVPLDGELAATVRRRHAELDVHVEAVAPPAGFVAKSAATRRVLADLDRAARTSMAVLLTGETGSGKDLAARHLHARSGRVGELVPINCAAIPNELIEGELFGYVRGAFSGAVADYDGLIRAATGGTVFLDEVDDTPKTLQVKLLRVLEDHVVSRLGENAWRAVDFRIIAATNRDLGELVRRGEFGADLYQRLAIVRIELPPRRDRASDRRRQLQPARCARGSRAHRPRAGPRPFRWQPFARRAPARRGRPRCRARSQRHRARDDPAIPYGVISGGSSSRSPRSS